MPGARGKKTKPLTAIAALRVWREIVEARERLKADALAARAGSTPPRVLTERQRRKQAGAAPKVRAQGAVALGTLTGRTRHASLMEVRLLKLDADLEEAERCVRGWRDIEALHAAALRLAPCAKRGLPGGHRQRQAGGRVALA